MDNLLDLLAQWRRQDLQLWVEGGELRVSAPPGVLTEQLVEVLRARKPELIAVLTGLGTAADEGPVAVPRDAPVPASFGQEQLWLLDRLGYRTVYHMPLAFELCGPLDSAALAGALADLEERHEGLRTSFVESPQGSLLQVIGAAGRLPLVTHDLSALDPAARESVLAELLSAERERPFDLSRGPLVRALAIRTGADRLVLLLILHHSVGDGWSLGVLLRELAACYGARVSGGSAGLAPLPIQLAEVAVWQRHRLAGERLARARDWWRAQLAGAPTLLELPTTAAPPAPREGGQPVQPRGARLECPIAADLTQGLRALARAQGATLFMTLLAAFQVLLGRVSGQEDLLVGTPVAGRVHPALEPLIGYFVNTLALRAQFADNPGFSDLLARVRQTTLAAYEHQELPFEQVVEALAVERLPHRNPLVQVLFTLQNAGRLELALPGISARALDLPTAAARMDLEVDLLEDGETLLGQWVYDSDRFTRADIERLALAYQTLLTAIVADPHGRVGALPLLPPGERQRLLIDWNDTAAELPPAGAVQRLFEAQAARTPTALALCYDGRRASMSLTYGAVNAAANRCAQRLIGLGVGPGQLVGLCCERSHLGVVGMLAALKAGAAYCPLDPALPPERLAWLLADTGIRVVLTQAHLAPRLADLPGSASGTRPRLVCLDEETTDAGLPALPDPQLPVDPAGLAYVIYTSGSSGEPKGVPITQRALLAHCCAYVERHALGPTDRVLALAAFHFDASVEQIFPALMVGAGVVVPDWELAPAEFSRQLAATGITLLDTSGFHWRALVETWLECPALAAPLALTRVVVGGDVMPAEVVGPWRRTGLAGRARLFNVYGPTETTVAASLFEVTADFDPGPGRVPIGRPLANRTLYVLDHRREPVPIGVTGELFIGGLAVAAGYLNRPELTRERFLPVAALPFAATLPAAARTGFVYRTGDLCRWRADGNLEFLGRADDQVKVRGYRVEPGEIEAQLRRQPLVRDAAVVVHERDGHRSLVAYVVPAVVPENGPDPAPAGALAQTLSAALGRVLPQHMVPTRFVPLAAIPRALGASDKVDRRALPDPDPASDAVPVAPGTPTQAQVLAVFVEVLKRPGLGVFDNFFDRGGHSLLATRVVARVNRVFDLELPLQSVFEHPTPAALAAAIDRSLLSRNLSAPGADLGLTTDEVGEL